MSTLEQAIQLATQQHAQQFDKAGVAYIQHPLKVMTKVESHDAKIVAVLHDILEDTPTTAQDLRDLGFNQQIIEAIEALTKHEGETRYQAMQRTALNALACQVKLADLSENMDLSRLNTITEKDLQRLEQYKVVQHYLQHAANCYAFVAQLNLPTTYPPFVFQQQFHLNYQYLLSSAFDVLHPLGSLDADMAHEWWILFEDVANYLSECNQQHQIPQFEIAMGFIQQTDLEFMNGAFQDAQSQHIFHSILQQMMPYFFNPPKS